MSLVLSGPLETDGAIGMVEPGLLNSIAEGMVCDNMAKAQIYGILQENFLRTATRVWR